MAEVTSRCVPGHGRCHLVSRQEQANPCRPRSRTGCTEAKFGELRRTQCTGEVDIGL